MFNTQFPPLSTKRLGLDPKPTTKPRNQRLFRDAATFVGQARQQNDQNFHRVSPACRLMMEDFAVAHWLPQRRFEVRTLVSNQSRQLTR
jgi:hypothetical protein